ncbi:MAG: phage integrase N-terminal SAM-like domain-containing protein, partial [Aquimonas sp.]|nr:phage integrase N-terminal SAM-like domain-containing protein [Aquimonas sp.]
MNASDQSETATSSTSTHFHTEMQRALRRQGLSEVTRDSYARAVRRLEGWLDVPLDQVGPSHLKDY